MKFLIFHVPSDQILLMPASPSYPYFEGQEAELETFGKQNLCLASPQSLLVLTNKSYIETHFWWKLPPYPVAESLASQHTEVQQKVPYRFHLPAGACQFSLSAAHFVAIIFWNNGGSTCSTSQGVSFVGKVYTVGRAKAALNGN